MKLEKKKMLASRALNVGVNRIMFNKERVSEIKEAITKQDIRDLVREGVIKIREVDGRKSKEKRKRRRAGSVRRPIHDRKGEYVMYIRRMRNYLMHLRNTNKINNETYQNLRKEVKIKRVHTKLQVQHYLKEKENAGH